MNPMIPSVHQLPGIAVLCGILLSSAYAGGSHALFDGKSLDGWHAYLDRHGVALRDVWSVRDGILICKGEPLGYLYTDSIFESFKLVVEWRWAPGKEPGNSGVLLRINGEPRPLPRCYEAQLKSGNAGALYGFHGMPMQGDPDRFIDREGRPFTGPVMGMNKRRAAENPAGEWNRYEIVLDGPDLTVRINGQLINEATGCAVLAGPIGLQSEGGEIHFRKVELAPLD